MLWRLLGRIVGFLLTLAFRIASRALWFFLGVMVSLAIRLSPSFFRLCVAATAWALTPVDLEFEGRLSERAAFTALAAGILWAFAGLVIPLILPLLLNMRPIFFSYPVMIASFVFGTVCGLGVQRLPGWGASLSGPEDSLHLGENIRW